MQIQLSEPSLVLSIIITLLSAIASAGGIWIKNLYNDNAFVKLAWYANDRITFFVVIPLLIISIYLSQRGSKRWLIIKMGLLGYVFYNFAFYLFGAEDWMTFNYFETFSFWFLYPAIIIFVACTIGGRSSNTTLKNNLVSC